jgi:hypothetical protein
MPVLSSINHPGGTIYLPCPGLLLSSRSQKTLLRNKIRKNETKKAIDDETNITTSVMCSNRCRGLVIGQKGCVVKRIKEISGCYYIRVLALRTNEEFSKILIKGRQAESEKATELFRRIINEDLGL